MLKELKLPAGTELKNLPAGEQLRIVSRLPEYRCEASRMTFEEHEREAERWGGHLVSIES